MGQEFTGELVAVEVENVFDEWGRLLDLPRIPGETPATHKTRLMDVFTHRAGYTHQGLVFGYNRELGLTIYDPGLVIKPYYLDSDISATPDLWVNVQADGVHISTSRFQAVRESHTIDRDSLRIELDKNNIDLHPTVEYRLVRVDRRSYEVDTRRNELVFDHSYAGADVTVTYFYDEVVPTTGNMNEVVSGINGVMLPGESTQVARAFLANSLSGTSSAEGLVLKPHESVFGRHESETGDYYNESYILWAPASIRALGDQDYVDVNLNGDGTYYGTILERLVESSRRISRITWSQTLFDRDRFSDILGLAEVPTLTDSKAAIWRCSDPTHPREYGGEQAAGLSMKCPRCSRPLQHSGIHPTQVQSGVGGENDLKVVVEDGAYEDAGPRTYDVVAGVNGEFVTPDTTTESEIDGEGY